MLGGVPSSSSSSSSAPRDYDAVRSAIAGILDAEGYDDGSYGPVLVRLAWHCAGTYDAKTGTGGSNGAAMRFDPEASHGANAGLGIARSLLEPIKKKFPWISYADLYTLAGAVAIEEMGGPKIEWAPGRSDFADGSLSSKDSRLPDASQGAKHLRAVFTTGMGFDDREIVALSGAHSLGRCHTDRSGFEGPWTRAPTTFSSLYFNELVREFFFFRGFFFFRVCFRVFFLEHFMTQNVFFPFFSFYEPQVNTKWTKRKWDGPLQYTNSASGDDLMMLPTDMVRRKREKRERKKGKKKLDLEKKKKLSFDSQRRRPKKTLLLLPSLRPSSGTASSGRTSTPTPRTRRSSSRTLPRPSPSCSSSGCRAAALPRRQAPASERGKHFLLLSFSFRKGGSKKSALLFPPLFF